MNCRCVIEFLTDDLERRLPFSQRLLFRLHLLFCGHCRAYLHNFQATILASKQACRESRREPDIPEELVQAVLRVRGP